jgi:hypothetical protein
MSSTGQKASRVRARTSRVSDRTANHSGRLAHGGGGEEKSAASSSASETYPSAGRTSDVRAPSECNRLLLTICGSRSTSVQASCGTYVHAPHGTGAIGQMRGIIECSLRLPLFSLPSEFSFFFSELFYLVLPFLGSPAVTRLLEIAILSSASSPESHFPCT